MRGARLGLGLAALAGGCLEADERAITLPSSDGEPTQCVTVEVEAFMPEVEEVVAVAADGAGFEGAWALVVDDPEPEDPGARLFLARQPGPDDPELDPVDLGFVLSSGEALRLYPGVLPGRAYLLRQGTGLASLWIVDSHTGLVASGTLTSIPGVGGVNDWDRHLIFVEGEPYLLAVPRTAFTLSVSYFAARIDADLTSATVWELPFVHPCDLEDPPPDPEACAALQPLRTEYIVGSTNPIVGGRDASVVLERRRTFDIDPGEQQTADLSLLRIELDGGSPSASMLTIPSHDQLAGSPPPIEPLQLAQDPFVTWALGDDILYAIDEAYPNATVWRSPFGVDSQLHQLPQSGVLGNVRFGRWSIAPYTGNDALVGGALEVRVVSEFGVAAVHPAGPGHFLVERLDGEPPMFVRLDCANFPPAP